MRSTVYPFLTGMVCVLIVYLVQLIPDPTNINFEISFFYQAFILAAAVEETIKFFLFLLLSFTNNTNSSPKKSLCLGSFLGLGFGYCENIMYLLRNDFSLSLFVVRFFTATILHVTLMGIVAYGFMKLRQNRFKRILIPLISSIGIHGFYNFFLLTERTLLSFVIVGTTLFVYICFISSDFVEKR